MSMSERTPLLPSILQTSPPFLPTSTHDSAASEHSRPRHRHSNTPPFSPYQDEPTRDQKTSNTMEPRADVNSPDPSAVDTFQDSEDNASVRGKIVDWQSPPLSSRVKDFFGETVKSDPFCQAQLLLYTFATGIIDLTTLVSYGCFASKQTGNTVFLAMRLADHPYIDEEQVNIYFSFGFFVAGVIAFAHIIDHVTTNRPRMRLALFLSAVLQTILTWLAAALVHWISDRDDWPVSAVIMALLAVQAGGQINLAFQLGLGEMNTTMVTGGIISICRDAKLFTLHNALRNRRAMYFVCFGLGCFTGSAISKYSTPCVGILVYAVLKTVLALSFLTNEGEEADLAAGEEEGRRKGRFSVWRMICGDF